MHEGLMVVGSKVELGDVDCCSVRNGDAVFDGAVDSRHFREHAHSLGVADQPCELFPDMAGAFDAVLLGDQESAANQQIEQRKFVGNRSEAMKLDEGSGQRAGKLPLRSEEHTSELQSPYDLVCRLLLEKKNNIKT